MIAVAVASALALVLQFAMLRLPAGVAVPDGLRWHVAAAGFGAAAVAWSGPGGPVATGVPAAGALVLLVVALRLRGVLRRLDARTGRPGGRLGLPGGAVVSVAAGLALTALAVLLVAGFDKAAAPVARQGTAFALASVLVGFMAASRPGPPAAVLGRLVVLADGVVLLGCAGRLGTGRVGAGLLSAALLLGPALLLVTGATLGRAGGVPAPDGDGPP